MYELNAFAIYCWSLVGIGIFLLGYGLVSGKSVISADCNFAVCKNPFVIALEYGVYLEMTGLSIAFASGSWGSFAKLIYWSIIPNSLQSLPKICLSLASGIVICAVTVAFCRKLFNIRFTNQCSQLELANITRCYCILSAKIGATLGCLLAIIFVIWNLNLLLSEWVCTTWPTVPVRTIHTETEGYRVTNQYFKRKVKAIYEFAVNGQMFKGNNIYLDDFQRPVFGLEKEAKIYQNALEDDRALVVHYNPKAPKENCLKTEPDFLIGFCRILIGVLLALASVGLGQVLKKRLEASLPL